MSSHALPILGPDVRARRAGARMAMPARVPTSAVARPVRAPVGEPAPDGAAVARASRQTPASVGAGAGARCLAGTDGRDRRVRPGQAARPCHAGAAAARGRRPPVAGDLMQREVRHVRAHAPGGARHTVRCACHWGRVHPMIGFPSKSAGNDMPERRRPCTGAVRAANAHGAGARPVRAYYLAATSNFRAGPKSTARAPDGRRRPRSPQRRPCGEAGRCP